MKHHGRRFLTVLMAYAIIFYVGLLTAQATPNLASLQLTTTPSNTPTDTPTTTPSNTPTDTPTNTPTGTASNTPTDTPTTTPSNTPTDTPTTTPSNTPSDTPTITPSNTPSDTPTTTATGTASNTPTDTPTGTASNTPTSTPTIKSSKTPTNTPTRTPTKTLTHVPNNRFTLVNADTNRDIGPLVNGAVVDLANVGRKLNVRADFAVSGVTKVVFSLGGCRFREEFGAPYALAGDSGGDYLPWTPDPDGYLLTAEAYGSAGGTPLASATIRFTVKDSASSVPQSAVFTLVNATTNADIRTLINGDTVDKAIVGNQLNVRANFSTPGIGSVVFSLNGCRVRVENGTPYTLAGDSNGDYFPWTPAAGLYDLTAKAYAQSNGTGTLRAIKTIRFTVVH